ncbi:hypothetical protein DQ04_03131010 [Trypanosoma grayi]|uniref:hypothetical protein n=1 Tax=Trypanosoma grayi TaxID=71804 RepID=UPI0004F494AB|nr:hypothetical protein DQ04_03131010 [Trypanosoma grayi]KEG10940.1 hypothetical protein DQ04_03131010 [Trypanosoma grayi]
MARVTTTTLRSLRRCSSELTTSAAVSLTRVVRPWLLHVSDRSVSSSGMIASRTRALSSRTQRRTMGQILSSSGGCSAVSFATWPIAFLRATSSPAVCCCSSRAWNTDSSHAGSRSFAMGLSNDLSHDAQSCALQACSTSQPSDTPPSAACIVRTSGSSAASCRQSSCKAHVKMCAARVWNDAAAASRAGSATQRERAMYNTARRISSVCSCSCSCSLLPSVAAPVSVEVSWRHCCSWAAFSTQDAGSVDRCKFCCAAPKRTYETRKTASTKSGRSPSIEDMREKHCTNETSSERRSKSAAGYSGNPII